MSMFFKVSLMTVMLFSINIASAGIIDINAQHSGWYQSNGQANGTKNNTCTGCFSDLRSWLGFDLSSISQNEHIIYAELFLFADALNDSNQHIMIFDVTSAYNLLGRNSTVVFNDLGSGNVYGSTIMGDGWNNSFLSGNSLIDLNNSRGGSFALGLKNLTNADFLGYNSGVTTSSQFYRLRLTTETVSVPEPSTFAIFALGLLGFVSRRLKK